MDTQTLLPIEYIAWGIIALFLAWAGGGFTTFMILYGELRDKKSVEVKNDGLNYQNLNYQRQVMDLEARLKIALSQVDRLSAEIAAKSDAD